MQSGFHGAVYARDIVGDSSKFDENNPLFGKIVVFTGTLERMTRRDAMQVVADLGGINGDTVTKKTNYLVLGNNDMCASIKDGKSTKQKKAEKYILDGADLAIISEDVFYDMLSEGPEILDPSTGSLPCAASQAEIYDIPHDGVELSGLETDFVRRIARILHDNPNYRNLTIERRTDNYVSIVIGYNDFLRFKCSPRAKWISLDLPQHIAAANIDNPIFAAQKNKGQRHWKASISSLDELDGLSDFINASCI